VLQNENLYLLSTKNCQVTVAPTTYKKLYGNEDKILNRIYRRKINILNSTQKKKTKRNSKGMVEIYILKT